MFHPTRDEFLEYAKRGNLVPVYRESACRSGDARFGVFEIARAGHPPEHGDSPFCWNRSKGANKLRGIRSSASILPASLPFPQTPLVRMGEGTGVRADSLDAVRDALRKYRAVNVPGLPRFTGGAVGFLTYDVVNQFERIRTHRNGNYQAYPLARFAGRRVYARRYADCV